MDCFPLRPPGELRYAPQQAGRRGVRLMAADGDGWRPAARPPRSEGGGGRGQLIYDYGAIAAAASTGADGHTASLGHILLASATSKKALLDAALRRAVTAWCEPLKEEGFAKIVRIRRVDRACAALVFPDRWSAEFALRAATVGGRRPSSACELVGCELVPLHTLSPQALAFVNRAHRSELDTKATAPVVPR